MIELRLIRHALALGRHRNFARAAASLHLTQPSLSRSIALLEAEVGVRLFDRTSSGVRPTVFGELLLERGDALLQGEADIRRELQLLAGLEVGTLALGVGPYPAEISVGTALGRLLRKHPGLHADVICEQPDAIARGVLSGQFDVGLCTALSTPSPPLGFEPLPPHDFFLACRPGHPLAGRDDLSLEDVTSYPLATGRVGRRLAGAAARGTASGTLDRATGWFTPAVHVNSLAVARHVAQASDALFPATAGMLRDDEEAGRLVRLAFRLPALTTNYGILARADRSPAPAVTVFIQELRDVEAEIAEAETAASRPGRPAPTRKRRGATARAA